MSKKWQIEYAVDAFGDWQTEAANEDEAWEKFLKAWHAGTIAPPADFSTPDANDVTIEENNE
jgi:hypothetical protein